MMKREDMSADRMQGITSPTPRDTEMLRKVANNPPADTGLSGNMDKAVRDMNKMMVEKKGGSHDEMKSIHHRLGSRHKDGMKI